MKKKKIFTDSRVRSRPALGSLTRRPTVEQGTVLSENQKKIFFFPKTAPSPTGRLSEHFPSHYESSKHRRDLEKFSRIFHSETDALLIHEKCVGDHLLSFICRIPQNCGLATHNSDSLQIFTKASLQRSRLFALVGFHLNRLVARELIRKSRFNATAFRLRLRPALGSPLGAHRDTNTDRTVFPELPVRFASNFQQSFSLRRSRHFFFCFSRLSPQPVNSAKSATSRQTTTDGFFFASHFAGARRSPSTAIGLGSNFSNKQSFR